MKEEKKINNISVLVVDDHPIFRTGIMAMLNKMSFISRCDEVEDGLKAVKAIGKFKYNIVLLDMQMPVMDGLETGKIIRKKYPSTNIIVLTMSDSKRWIRAMLDIGVAGYVLKSADEEELSLAIKQILNGDQYLSKEVRDVWSQYLMDQHRFNRVVPHKIELSAKETEIIILICEQYNTEEIAAKLDVSVKTVESHRYHIMKKLNIDNVVGIALYAVKSGIFVP